VVTNVSQRKTKCFDSENAFVVKSVNNVLADIDFSVHKQEYLSTFAIQSFYK